MGKLPHIAERKLAPIWRSESNKRQQSAGIGDSLALRRRHGPCSFVVFDSADLRSNGAANNGR